MVNPLHGFISADGRLFRSLDSEGEGINVTRGRGILASIFDQVFGRVEAITVAGDTLFVEKKSAQLFFDRNRQLLEGIDDTWMTLGQKLLSLMKYNKELPFGLPLEKSSSDEGTKNEIVGGKRQFARLARELQKNAFEVSFLVKLIQEKESGFIRVEREEIFRNIIEENKRRLEELRDSYGDDKIRLLASLLIECIRKEGRV